MQLHENSLVSLFPKCITLSFSTLHLKHYQELILIWFNHLMLKSLNIKLKCIFMRLNLIQVVYS